MIRIRFVGGTDIVSLAISAACYGFWASHVDAVMPDGSMLGAHGTGVQERPAGYDASYLARDLVVEIGCPQHFSDRFYAFVQSQLGKPYDYGGIGQFANGGRKWETPDAWFCSELIAAALIHCGYLRELAIEADRISPRDLFLVLSAVGAVKR